MKINEVSRLNNVQSYKKVQDASSLKGGEKIRSKDEVTISSEAKALLESQRTEGRVSTEKLESLKQSVKEGSYHVDARRIADKMTKHFETE
jgi:negative regulator of flagellin synthesis FlgM